jgi:hypothetical protein
MLTLSKALNEVTKPRSVADVWEQGYQDGRDALNYVNVFTAGTEEQSAFERGYLAGKLARAFAGGADQLPRAQ